MEIESLLGLPAHPLLVHAMVVLVPLVTTGIVAASLSRRVRRVVAPLLVAAALGLALFTPLVTGSGDALTDRVRETDLVEEHEELGENFLLFSVLLLAGAALVGGRWLLERDEARSLGSATAATVTAVAILLAIVPTVRVAQVGHSGAAASWSDVGPADD